MLRMSFLFCLALLSASVFAGEAAPAKKYKLLYISQSKGFVHGSVKRPNQGTLSPSEQAVTEIGQTSGLFDVECSQDASIITPEKLKELDAIMFYTTGQLPIDEKNFAAFEEWLKSGKAFIGTHSATDTFGNFKPYFSLINGTFAGHPWNAGDTVTITNHEPNHPTVKVFGEEFQYKDEIYQYKNYDPKAVRVLLSLNMEKTKPSMPYMVPVAWVREFGQGRLFYTNLGHNEATWKEAKFREHLLMGIRWALKLEDGPATPNPEVQAEIEAKSKAAGLKAQFESAKTQIADLAKANGKDGAALVEKYVKLREADAAFGDAFWKTLEAYRRIDAKKEPDRKKAEALKVLEVIEKK